MSRTKAANSCRYVTLCFILCGALCGCEVPELESPPQVAPPTAEATPSAQPQASPAETSQATSSPSQQPTNSVAQQSSTTGSQVGAAAQEQQPASASAPAGEGIEARRGLELEDWPDGFVYILVKANAEKVAEAIAAKLSGQAVPSKMGEPLDAEQIRTIVGQFKGHPWSHLTWFTWTDDEPENLLAELSRQLNTDAIMVSYSDFSGWQFVDVYRHGESVEAFHWGLDYSDELGGPDLTQWDTHTKVTENYEGIDMTDQFLFRSKLRKVNETELGKGDAFADWLLREHDAYLSDTGMVWVGEDSAVFSPLGPDAFSSVYVVTKGQ